MKTKKNQNGKTSNEFITLMNCTMEGLHLVGIINAICDDTCTYEVAKTGIWVLRNDVPIVFLTDTWLDVLKKYDFCFVGRLAIALGK